MWPYVLVYLDPARAPRRGTRRRLSGLVAVAIVLTTLFAVAGAGTATAGTCAAFDPFAASWAGPYLDGLGAPHLAAAVEDVSTGCRFHLGSTDVFPPASAAKAEILGAALLRSQDAGQATLPATVAQWAVPMITQSDNAATSALYTDLGGGWALNAYGRRLGLTVTDNTVFDWGGSPTTPDDQLTMLHTMLAGGGALGPAGVAEARSLMSAVVPEQAWGVSAGAPDGSSVFLKNGWLFNDGTQWGPAGFWRVNSIGLVQLPNGREYSIAVFGDTWKTMADGVAAIETLARHVAAVLAAPRTGGVSGGADPGAAGSGPASSASSSVGSVPSVFTATSPTRLLDTRTTGRAVPAGGEVTVDVAHADAAPADGRAITAVALNVTAVDAAGSGYVTAYPGGRDRPLASNLNTRAGAVTPNLAIVPVGADGTVRLFTSTATSLVVDLLGTWSPASGVDAVVAATGTGVPARAGRVVATPPSRLLDTRQAGGRLSAGGQVTVAVAGHAGVPASGAAAVVVNVTATDVTRAGYWTVWPGGGTARPTASTLNTAAGETAANTTLVPIGPDGTISVFSQSGGELVVDVLGWVTADGAGDATAGELVVLAAPTRAVDSRFGDGGVDRLASGSSVAVDLRPVGVPAGASAMVGNLTYAAPTADGFLTAYPAGGVLPASSSANPSTAAGFGANAVLTALGGAAFDLYANVSTDVVVDAWGWFTG